MEYRISRTQQGEFELAQVVPQVIGTFADKGMAEKVMWLLSKDGQLEDVSEPAPVADAPADARVMPPIVEGPIPAKAADVEDTADCLAAAFARLENGEKLKAVAQDLGIPWTSLRGSWSQHARRNGKKATAPQQATSVALVVRDKPHPLDVVKGAIAAVNDMEDCRNCGRSFTPSEQSIELCARCAKD